MKRFLSLSLLVIAVAATDTFHFTQCQCPLLRFSSEQQNHFSNAFEAAADSELFSCVGDSEFPTESGVILNLGNGEIESLKTTAVKVDLFQESSGERHGWHASFRISLNPVPGTEFGLISVFDATEKLFSVEAAVVTKGGFVNLMFLLNDVNLVIPMDDVTETSFHIVLGEVFQSSINGGLNVFDAAFICVSTIDSTFHCAFSDGVMRSLKDINIEILKSNPSSVSLPVTLSIIHFEETSFEVVETQNKKDFLDELGFHSSLVFAQNVPKDVSLPYIGQPIEFKGFKNLDLEDDLTNVLDGGNIDFNDLVFSVTKDVSNGSLDKTKLPLLSYRPNKDFVGQDFFSFTYGASSQVSCQIAAEARINITRSIVISEDLTENVFASFPFVYLSKLVIDLLGEEGNFEGSFNILNAIPGLLSINCGDTAPANQIDIKSGIVTFCFTPDLSVVSGVTFILEFMVTNVAGLSEFGRITFFGNSPVFAPPQTPVETGTEDNRIRFALGEGRYGQKIDAVPLEDEIWIRILKLPSLTQGFLMDFKFHLVD